jgi:hypothetical protein
MPRTPRRDDASDAEAADHLMARTLSEAPFMTVL